MRYLADAALIPGAMSGTSIVAHRVLIDIGTGRPHRLRRTRRN